MEDREDNSSRTPRDAPHVLRMEKLYSLRDRLSKATGPEPEIDVALDRLDHVAISNLDFTAPAYTASLDATVTLVPEDANWTVSNRRIARPARAIICRITRYWHEAEAATPALALCLARIEYEIAKTREPASRGEANPPITNPEGG